MFTHLARDDKEKTARESAGLIFARVFTSITACLPMMKRPH
jgi:hypothetical protein